MTPEARIETFLTRFAAGAGTQYRWQLTRQGYLVTVLPSTTEMGVCWSCPISAQVTLERGGPWYRHQARTIASAVDLTHDEAWFIAHAADTPLCRMTHHPRWQELAAMRTRLLRMCHVREAYSL